MGLFSGEQHQEDYNNFQNTPHHGSITHDALGAAVAYEVAKAYENHVAKNGKPDSHAKAKELIAGLVGGAFVHLAQTKGADAWDSYKQKQAEKKAMEHIDETVINVNQYNEC